MKFSPFSGFQEQLLYIWIWHADKVPPHIGCSANGLYFSLKVSGLDLNFPSEKALMTIKRKSIPFLLVETSLKFSSSDLEQQFLLHKNAIAEGKSCLYPIKQLLQHGDEIEKVKDLLALLQQKNEIKHIFGFNLNEAFVDIPDYTEADIQQRLQYLSNVKG